MRPGLGRGLCLAALICGAGAPAAAQGRAQVADDIDRFVLAHFDRIQPPSIRENREYCGLVGFDADGLLAVTPARPGTVDSCDPGAAPPGFEVIASYHTHGGYTPDADSEVPSVDDLLGDLEDGIDGYVATPGGRVWLNLSEEELTFQLCGRGCVPADPTFRACPADPPAIDYTLNELRAREANGSGPC